MTDPLSQATGLMMGSNQNNNMNQNSNVNSGPTSINVNNAQQNTN